MVKVANGSERVRTDDAVRRQAEVALELANCIFGESAEDAILATTRETEGAERSLQLEHVVTMEVRHAQIQGAVTHVVRRINEHRPGLLVDFVTVFEPRLAAERAHGVGGLAAELAVDGFLGHEPHYHETLLHVLDCSARITLAYRLHVCCSSCWCIFQPG